MYPHVCNNSLSVSFVVLWCEFVGNLDKVEWTDDGQLLAISSQSGKNRKLIYEDPFHNCLRIIPFILVILHRHDLVHPSLEDV